jgi:DNA-binding NarL/FixJ family response regulator
MRNPPKSTPTNPIILSNAFLAINATKRQQTITIGVVDSSEISIHGYLSLFAMGKYQIIHADHSSDQANIHWNETPIKQWPDVMLISSNVKRMNACALIRLLRKRSNICKIIVVGNNIHDDNKLARFFRAGANGYITVNANFSRWLTAIDAVTNSKFFVQLSNESGSIINMASKPTELALPEVINAYNLFRVMEGYNDSGSSISFCNKDFQQMRQTIFKHFKVKNHLELTKLAIAKNFIMGDKNG